MSSDIQPIVHVLILERWGIFVCVCACESVCMLSVQSQLLQRNRDRHKSYGNF